MTFPKTYEAASAPPEVVALVSRLVPQLIAGDPALAALREQLRFATIRDVQMIGHGSCSPLVASSTRSPRVPIGSFCRHTLILRACQVGSRRRAA
jgi:hypothetical protein